MKALIVGLMLFTGCAQISAWTDAQKTCASNPECLADVKGYAKIGEAVASPFGPIAAAGASAVIIFAGLGIKGLILKKKENS